jgi:ribosome biogenesis SPOUT family RNA methylase Rps3
MKKQSILVIEHCEPKLSEWLMLEYSHSAKIWSGETLFTNVSNGKTANALKLLGSVEKKKAKEIFYGKNCVILDPQSKKTLTTKDFTGLDAIIVGGILGYEKPQGRTKELLSDKSGFETRHIGKIQLTIDGAVFVAKAISLGMKLSDIEITYEIEIVHDSVHSTILPFGYPVVDNKPVITPGLFEFLTRSDRVEKSQ